MNSEKLAQRIEQFNTAIGELVAWLTLVMVLITFAVVVLRYWFDIGWIWLQESVTWMHAAVFMLAAAYTLARDEHVRVDIFYSRLSDRNRAMVDALGTIVFLLPVTFFLVWSSWNYVIVSWTLKETSSEAGGMVYPMISVMKSFIPAMATLLLLQGVAMLLRAAATLVSDKS
jgi:TRAP-type mannitol/chloroaromatic compound transport system permease small subunit